MEFTVSKSDLVRELGLSQGVVEKKATIPILTNVLVEALDDQLVLTATDLELGIRCSCPARVSRRGAGTIPARKLLDYVRLLPDADVHFKVGENHWANLTCGRARTRIAGMSKDSFPELPQMPPVLGEFSIGTLASMISRTIFAISAEESRFTLHGSLLHLKPGQLTMVATDGHRLALVERQEDVPGLEASYRALLPRKAMGEILKFASAVEPETPLKFAGDENHLFFQLGDRLLITRKLTGNFPDYERVLPKDQPHIVQLRRDDLRSAIERVVQFADERSHAIRIRFAPDEAKLSSSLSDTGETEETIPATYSGGSVEMSFNGQYLLDFLRVIGEEQLEFRFKEPNTAGELRPISTESAMLYRYIVMPMRL
ncbi:MAG: DNA polymerase III subunit beta [Bryobacteraceae bacterium]|nr:DNA polymerase III subunit beta [Bryobacteraceae bacterium]MDW8378882.1 DNA polymerase III subunit beta [Bryobacterales bacterium]